MILIPTSTALLLVSTAAALFIGTLFGLYLAKKVSESRGTV